VGRDDARILPKDLDAGPDGWLLEVLIGLKLTSQAGDSAFALQWDKSSVFIETGHEQADGVRPYVDSGVAWIIVGASQTTSPFLGLTTFLTRV
jgi:hypothetical protein